MDSTMQPDMKLMVLTEYRPKASSTGLMITPPPMPQMQPITDAKKLTRINKSCVMMLFPHPQSSCAGHPAPPHGLNGSIISYRGEK